MFLFQDELGVSIESFPDKGMGTGLFRNGFFRKLTNSVGTFTYKLTDAPKDLGLTVDCEFDYEPSKDIPKIPYNIYEEIEKFYKFILTKYKTEVYCSVVWDKEKKDFFINVPKQVVSHANVDYENEVLSNENWVEILQTHSHCDFQSFFSAGDNADEVGGKLFGVIGMLHTDNPTSVWRAGFNRQTKPLELSDIFGPANDRDYSINYTEALSKIRLKPVLRDLVSVCKYDYQILFDGTKALKEQDILNIYSSLTAYIGQRVNLTEDLLDSIVQEVENAGAL